MLAKLIRYEFKALMRILPALYLGIQVLALASGLNSHAGQNIFTKIVEMLWSMTSVAVLIINFAVVTLRFRDNLLKDEGYLMFTLPVGLWELILSKAIAAFCSVMLSLLALSLSNLIYGLITDFDLTTGLVSQLFQALHDLNIGYLKRISIILLALVVVFQQLFLIYAAMIVSRIVPRFRGLVGFGVFFAVMILVEFPISTAATTKIVLPDNLELLALALLQAAFAALYFWTSHLLLKRHFNME
jgi:hypothetical protein